MVGILKYFELVFMKKKNCLWKDRISPFLANVSILYPLERPKHLWFSSVFRGYKLRTLARNGFMKARD